MATIATGAATRPRVLAVAGTDPTGGAGIQADLKSIAAHGGYGMAVVTALVAQNTHGVRALHVPPPAFLAQQLRAVSDDVEIDAVKLGMLYSADLVDVVAAWLDDVRPPIVVLDPVLGATSETHGGGGLLDDGARLLDDDTARGTVAALRALCSHVDVVTPNIPELAVLCGEPEAAAWDPAVVQARALADRTGATVLLKGGHLAGDDCPDALVTPTSVTVVPGRRVGSTSTHGTGCSLSSALATLAASGLPWHEALTEAKAWLAGAIAHGEALAVGSGPGPVDHFHHLRG
ncbi:phosphomethylpyrimidine kinase [Xylanimonas cellulosilytica DSM 15894]|uniref:Phosphomethylpyrimidine kinase n=1 Tax=Xylanimonas cellulosilytica (strain DSM 15894 / JCM 12276 / CECT 5975 / KCTC 9989 / LMG 20990 / NBRC 107835 / XIL07) TaxID=446471 RepID=D1BRZ2_XYLCX|nr:phosphomethylpyrimidine kinase [Xylanimonas cellulosilytica DSM 15894]